MKVSVKVKWDTDAVMKKVTGAWISSTREMVMKIRCREHGKTAQLGPKITKGDILHLQFPCCCDGLKQQIKQALSR